MAFRACFIILALSGCAYIEAAEEVAPVLIDKAMDKTYGLTCNMRFQTEARFRARHQLSEKNVRDWCKRKSPQ